jgi:hypothetical protein
VLNKLDLIPEDEREQRVADFPRAYDTGGAPCFRISAINGDGCRPLIYKLQEALDTLAPPPPRQDVAGRPLSRDEKHSLSETNHPFIAMTTRPALPLQNDSSSRSVRRSSPTTARDSTSTAINEWARQIAQLRQEGQGSRSGFLRRHRLRHAAAGLGKAPESRA